MIFKKQTTPKQLKLNLNSQLSINLIDTLLVDLHPAFIRPEGWFSIQAIAALASNVTLYAENNGNAYMLELDTVEDRIEALRLYQNVLTLTPSEEEWTTLLAAISAKNLDMDGIAYQRALGGQAEHADLFDYQEHIQTREDAYDCQNKMMLFERRISPNNFQEQLKVIVEVIESQEQADVAFYVGFSLHPSTLTLLGH